MIQIAARWKLVWREKTDVKFDVSYCVCHPPNFSCYSTWYIRLELSLVRTSEECTAYYDMFQKNLLIKKVRWHCWGNVDSTKHVK